MRINTKKLEGTAEIIGVLIINGFKAGYDDDSDSSAITINNQTFIDLDYMPENLTVDILLDKANKFVRCLNSNKGDDKSCSVEVGFNDALKLF